MHPYEFFQGEELFYLRLEDFIQYHIIQCFILYLVYILSYYENIPYLQLPFESPAPFFFVAFPTPFFHCRSSATIHPTICGDGCRGSFCTPWPSLFQRRCRLSNTAILACDVGSVLMVKTHRKSMFFVESPLKGDRKNVCHFVPKTCGGKS